MKPSPAGIESSKLGSNQKRQLLADTPPSSMATEREGDVQKKIMPWSNPASVVAELFPESSSLTMPRLDLTKSREEGSILCSPRLRGEEGEGEGEGGLVLVASLLNKIPNLGGEFKLFSYFINNSYVHAYLLHGDACIQVSAVQLSPPN